LRVIVRDDVIESVELDTDNHGYLPD
jgi:hypothetical protein